MNANGYKSAPNMGRYMAEMYQLYYLNGMMAAALSKTGKLGYVATLKVPQLNRHINAFTLGARAVNPDVQVNVKWLGGWLAPEKAKAAAEKLVSEGNDVLMTSEESPTVMQVAQAKGVLSFSHSTPLAKYGLNAALSGHLLHWESIYINVLNKIKDGTYTTKTMTKVNHLSFLRGGAVELGSDYGVAVNPKYIPALKAATMKADGKTVSVYTRVMELNKIMATSTKFDPFTGPIPGSSLVAGSRPSEFGLMNMDWMVRGINEEDLSK